MVTVHRWWRWLMVLLIGVGVAQATAQTNAPAYSLRYVTRSTEGTALSMVYAVSNTGADDLGQLTVTLRPTDQTLADLVLAEVTLDGLPSNTRQNVTLTFDARLLPPNSVQPLLLSGVTTGGGTVIPGPASVVIPAYDPSDALPPAQRGGVTQPTTDPLAAPLPAWVPLALRDALADVGVQTRGDAAWWLGVVLGGLLGVWLLSVLGRALLRKPTIFGAQLPPYATMPSQDPNALGGRRQQWQQLAQNGSVLAEPADGALHVRKLLVGTDGALYSGWRLGALRVNQYDAYGRVQRSQVLAPRATLRTLNQALARGGPWTPTRVRRTVTPLARRLARALRRRMSARSAALPVALDARFTGEHGEVGIVFELFQHQAGRWQLLDRWEPDMLVNDRTIHETYTYTVYGQQPGESVRAFHRRLETALAALLAGMVQPHDPQQPHSQPSFAPPTAVRQPPVGDISTDTPARPTTPVGGSRAL